MRGLALLIIALSLAACGGGSNESSSSPEGSASVDLGAAGAFSSSDCTDAVRAMAAAAAAVPAAVSGTQNDLEQPLDQLKAFADAAPDEIKDDLQTVAEGYAAFAQAIKDSGFDPSSGQPPSGQVIAAITAASQKLNTSDFRAAVNNVNTWFKEQCGQ